MEHSLLPNVQRLSKFIGEVLLELVPQTIVIFVDEIDSILSLNFNIDDFFAVIRDCYNKRAARPDYRRLTFALIGVATPSDLIQDRRRTPFNIGRAIEMAGFQLEEARPLEVGLAVKASNPRAVLQAVLDWTGGQPFLTQKVCRLIGSPLFKVINFTNLENKPVSVMVEKELAKLRPYSEDLTAWLASDCQDESRLLRGQKLQDALAWAANKSLSNQDYQFLAASQELEKQEVQKALEEERKRRELEKLEAEINLEAERQAKQAQEEANQILTDANQKANRRIRIGSAVLFATLALAAVAGIWANKAVREAREAHKGSELERAGASALRQFESGQEIEALLSALQSGQELKALVKDGRPPEKYPALSPVSALLTILNNIRERHQFKAHQGGVSSVSFSPDGKTIATAGDGTVRLGNLSGQQLAEWKAHQDGVLSVSFSPDGKTIATAGNGGTARLWNLSGQQLAVLKGHQGLSGVTSVSFSPNGKTVATAGVDGTARLWNLAGQQLAVLKGHQRGVKSVSFSPDGKTVATAGVDGTARLWNLSGQQLAEWKGHQDGVNSASFSPDGKTLATAGNDGRARLWNLAGQQLAEWKAHKLVVYSVSFSPDGKTLLATGWDGTARLWLWNLAGQQLAEFKGHQNEIKSASFSPDGKLLATTGGWDGTARLWNLSGEQLAEWKAHQEWVYGVSFSPDGKLLATAGDGGARLWNLKGQQLAEFKGH